IVRPLLPIDLFLRNESVKLGFTNFLSSSTDGVVRRGMVSFPLHKNGLLYWFVQHGLDKQRTKLTGLIEEKKIPHHLSFAAEMIRASDDYTLRKGIDKQLGRRFWIDFTSPNNLLFRVYSSAHLLDDRLSTELFGAVVILGSAYTGSTDRFPTPLSVSTAPLSGLWGVGPVISQELPGAFVHAYAVHTLKKHFRGEVPFHVGPWWPFLIAVIIGALQAWMGVLRFSLLTVPESIGILTLLYVAICIWLFESHYGLLPIIRPVVGYMFAFSSVRHFLLNFIQGEKNAKEQIVE
ncbi:MAG: CHASE2 domain-containing protein, partial [Desulfobacteraceae bacterium]|nr:CHASE2 domain-containing protein [Desulfobacteraceae bacterium]